MHPLGARGLHEWHHAERLKRVTDRQGGSEDLGKAGTRHRIEIEVQVVGAVDVVTASVPLIEVDAAEVDDPEE